MSLTSRFTRRAAVLGASALTSATLLAGGAFAQQATPPATPGGPPEGFPVAIHNGTCGDLSEEPAYELGDAITFGTHGEGGNPQTIGGEEGVRVVIYSTSGTIDTDLQTLGSESHAVVVHTQEDSSQVIACGNIAGAVSDGMLPLAVAPVEPSTVYGVAIMEESDGQTNATVYLFDNSVAENVPATPPS